MKKLLLLSFAVLTALAVSCGGKKSDTGEIMLTVWSQAAPDVPEGKIQKQYVDKFNEKYKGKYKADIQFIVRGDAGTGFDDKVNAAITADELPDVLHIDGPNIASFAANGLIVPLDEYYTKESLATFIPSIIDQGTFNGKLYALGALESAVVLFYNKDMFEKAGVKPSTGLDDIWTWDDLYKAAKKIKETQPDVLPLDMHLNEWTEWLIYGYLPFIQSADLQNKGIVSSDGLTVKGYLNSPYVKEAFRFIQKMCKEGLTSISPAQGVFRNGKAAMLLYGVWELENFRNNFKDLNFDYMIYPRHPNGRVHGPTGSWTFAVTSSSKNQEAAAELVLWLSESDISKDESEATGMPPTHTTSIEQLPAFGEGGNNYLVMQQLIKFGTPRPKTPVYPFLSYHFQASIQAIAQGEDVDKVVEDMTEKVEKELEKYRK